MEDKKKGKNISGKEIAIDLGIAVAIAFAVSIFFRPTIVYETSMQPSIDPKDYLIMSRQAYRFGDIERGDVVIVKSELKQEETGKNKLLIKRVIGLPGDIITIADGNVYLNGSKVEEEYIAEGGTNGELHNFKVPDGEVFLMGDHRHVSRDSRELGTFKTDDIVGRAVYRLYPFNKMKAI